MPKKLYLLVFIFTLFLIVPAVRADDDSGVKFDAENTREKKQFMPERDSEQLERRKDLQKKREELQLERKERVEQRQERREQICANFETRSTERVQRFYENKTVHIEKYNKLKTRLTEIGNKLEDKGLDVSQLRKDLIALDELIKKYASAYVSFIESLEFTKGFACGEKDEDFRANLAISKDKLDIVRAIREEIRTFYKDVLRVDIQELRKQAEEMRDVTEENSMEVENE